MKRLFTSMVLIALTINHFAQSPQKMSYQAVIRNSSNQLVASHAVGMRISILQGSATGTAVFVETHTPTTDKNGLVTVEIGGGSVVSGTFAGINWAAGPYYLKTETDPSGGSVYSVVGTSQLLNVPYALHSKSTESYSETDPVFSSSPAKGITSANITNWTTAYGWGNHTGLYRPNTYVPSWSEVTGKPAGFADGIDNVDDADNSPSNEIQTLSLNGANLTLSAGGGTVGIPGDNWGTQKVETDATLYGNGTAALPLKIAQQSAASGQVLKWNGTSWAPSSDLKGELILPWEGSMTNTLPAFKVTNNATGAGADAIQGITNSTSSDAAIYGLAAALTGNGIGIYGCAFSPNGYSGYFDSGKLYISGNTGIGVSNPTAKLEVNGQVKITGGSPGTGKVLTSDAAGLGSWSTPDLVLPYNDAVSSDFPVFSLTNTGAGNGLHVICNSLTGTTGSVIGDNYSSSGSGVTGNALASGGTTFGIKGKVISGSGYSGYFEGGRFYVQGNTGIGINSPSEKLEVNGNLQFTAGGNRYVVFPDNTMSLFVGGKPGAESAYALFFMTDNGSGSGVERLTIKSDKVGIGTVSPSQTLDVNGNGRFRSVGSGAYAHNLSLTSDGTLTTVSSDVKLKDNIVTLQNSLRKVMELRGVSFTWRNNPEYGNRIGFIAQEFEKVLPELVFTNETDGYKGINYPEVTAVLVEAIKEQQKQIDELKQLVQSLIQK